MFSTHVTFVCLVRNECDASEHAAVISTPFPAGSLSLLSPAFIHPPHRLLPSKLSTDSAAESVRRPPQDSVSHCSLHSSV